MRGLIELVITVAIAVVLALLIQAFIVKPYRIPSPSMVPTLDIGQRVLTNRLAGNPGIGDIEVFHPPHGADFDNPVCGDPNQGGQGGTGAQACDKPTAQESTQTFIKRVVGVPGDTIQIVNGHVIRNGKRESDAYITACGGAAECTFSGSIRVPAGQYYMMGDNRGDSDDSRYWGPVPQRYVIGVGFFTYWPLDRIGVL